MKKIATYNLPGGRSSPDDTTGIGYRGPRGGMMVPRPNPSHARVSTSDGPHTPHPAHL